MTVTVVEPGFTHTEFQDRAGMTENAGMPDFVWQSADEVADATLAGARKGQALVVPGVHNRVAAGLSALVPRNARRRAVGLMTGPVLTLSCPGRCTPAACCRGAVRGRRGRCRCGSA